MPIVVGNLLSDPSADTFISLADAEAYLTDEGGGAGEDTALGQWFILGSDAKESSLVRASRWMAANLSWCCGITADADLARIGHVAARLAVASQAVDLWSGTEIGKDAKRYKADGVEVEYHTPTEARGARAGGRLFPWVHPMLKGLLCGSNGQHNVVRR